MNKLQVNDCCPKCWHSAKVTSGGIGTYCIYEIITHTGGILDKTKTCNKCQWNFNYVKNCLSCRSNKPCPVHHAVAFDGKYAAHLSAPMQQLYMCNSPYQPVWNNRAYCVGTWYAKQVTNYTEAIHMARRFLKPDDFDRCRVLNQFEHQLRMNVDSFWVEFHNIYVCYFCGTDMVSRAMAGFYNGLRANHLFLALYYYQ
mgnify:FL=1